VERAAYRPVRTQFIDLRAGGRGPPGRACGLTAGRFRLGRIPWINESPVTRAIDLGIVPVDAELVTGTASELNDLMAAGELDVSLVSAVEYAKNAGAYHLLPDLAISCDGPVRSVKLFSRRPLAELEATVPDRLPTPDPAARPALPASLAAPHFATV
jgi:hypothetical protein